MPKQIQAIETAELIDRLRSDAENFSIGKESKSYLVAP